MEDFYSSVLLCPFHSRSYFLIYHYIFVDLLWQSQFGLLVLAVFWTSRFIVVFLKTSFGSVVGWEQLI